MLILTFDLRLQWVIAGFLSRNRKAEAPLYIGPATTSNENNHENVHIGSKNGKRCKWHCMQQMKKETVYGCQLCNVDLCKDGCHIAYLINNINHLFVKGSMIDVLLV